MARARSQEGRGSGWCPVVGHLVAAAVCTCLCRPRWQWQLVPAPRAHVGCTLLPESAHMEKEAPVVVLPLSLHAPQQWRLTSLAGPGLFLYSLGFGAPHPSPPQAVSMQPTPVLCLGLTSKAQASAPSPHLPQRTSISGWGVLGSALTVCAGISPLCLLQTGCCALLRGSEAPPLSQLISPPVRGLPRVWKPFPVPSWECRSCHNSFLSFFFFLYSFVLHSYLEIFLPFWKSAVFCQRSLDIL